MKTAVYTWAKLFFEGRESVTDEVRSGRPVAGRPGLRTEENIANVRQIVRENRRLTVRNIAEHRNIEGKSGRKILTEDLDTRKVCAKTGAKGAHRKRNQRRIFSYRKNNCVETPCLFTGSSLQ